MHAPLPPARPPPARAVLSVMKKRHGSQIHFARFGKASNPCDSSCCRHQLFEFVHFDFRFSVYLLCCFQRATPSNLIICLLQLHVMLSKCGCRPMITWANSQSVKRWTSLPAASGSATKRVCSLCQQALNLPDGLKTPCDPLFSTSISDLTPSQLDATTLLGLPPFVQRLIT